MDLKDLPVEYTKLLILVNEPIGRRQRREAFFEAKRMAEKLQQVIDAFESHISNPLFFDMYEIIYKEYNALWQRIVQNVIQIEKPKYCLPHTKFFSENYKTQKPWQ